MMPQRVNAQVIARELATAIAAGRYPSGGRLPSILALSVDYGVSTGTVGRALRQIGPAVRGLEALARPQGNQGWFVL